MPKNIPCTKREVFKKSKSSANCGLPADPEQFAELFDFVEHLPNVSFDIYLI